MPKSLASTLKSSKSFNKQQSGVPVWKGPSNFEDWNGGVTFSMLSRFLVCRERFRLQYVEGLAAAETFQHRLEYGNMWHLCEEAHARGEDHMPMLRQYCQELIKQHRTQQEQVVHWYNVCAVQFPVYVDYWSKHQDVVDKENVAQEVVADVRYPLPSGRDVRLRGKLDSVDWVRTGKSKKLFLQENKTKADIDEQQVKTQLQADLQSMLYLLMMTLCPAVCSKKTLSIDSFGGIRYNVVRRPLSGGRHSIRMHQPSKSNPKGESPEEFYNRLKELIVSDPGYFFMRWNAVVMPGELQKFERVVLTPILEQLCDWWQYMELVNFSPWSKEASKSVTNRLHWQHPYGIYNIVNEGGSSDVDEYLSSGSEVGLVRQTKLFRELES